MRISDWSSDVCSSDLAYRLEHSLGTGSAAATYTVTDGDGDTATAPIAFTIVDANVPTAGETQASVDDDRSEERRAGQEGVSTCRSRGSTDHYKTKKTRSK